MALVLAACTAGGPTATPIGPSSSPTAAPSADAATMPPSTLEPTGAPSGVPTAAPSPSAPPTGTPPGPSPSPVGGAWTEVGPVAAPGSGARLAAVRGSAGAADGRAGFELRATGDVPLDTLLERLRVEPVFAYRVATAADRRSATLVPLAPLPAGARYRFTLLGPDAVPVTGWAFEVAGPLHVVSTLPSDEATDVPATTGIEVTFDREAIVGDGDVVVRLLPGRTVVRGALERHGRAVAFVPASRLLAGRVYEVGVRVGAGADGELPGLARAVSFAFRVATVAKSGTRHAAFEEPFVSTVPGARAVIRAEAWRQRSDGDEDGFTTPVRMRIYRFGGEASALAALGTLLESPEWAGSRGRIVVPTSGLELAFAGSVPFTTAGGESRLRIPLLGRGWYLLELRENEVNQAILQVTEVTAVAASRERRLIAWVNDGRAGAAIRGATVAVVNGATLGRTDADGILAVDTPADLSEAAGPVLIRATAPGGHRVVVLLASDAAHRWDPPWMERRADGAWWSALATDRWLYRTTDTIDAWGYLRTRTGKLPARVTLRVWREPDEELRTGRPLAEATARRASTGAFLASLAIRDLPYGSYVLESLADGTVVDRAGFTVGDVRKPSYRLDVTASPRAVVSGTRVTARVTARFFEDTPVAQLPVVVSTYGLERSGGTDDWDYVNHHATTSTAGRATVRIVPRVPGDESQERCDDVSVGPGTASEAEITADQEICVYRAAVYVDAEATRSGGSIVISGAVHRVDLAAVERQLADRDAGDAWVEIDPRGRPVAGTTVRIRVTEQVLRRTVTRRWYDPITKQVREEYDTVVSSERTRTYRATTRGDGTFRLRLEAPAKNRAWVIRATARDAAGRETSTESSVEAARTGRETRYFEVQLRGDRDEFAVGETVTAEIRAWTDGGGSPAAPTGGANRYLFIVSSPGRFQPVVRRSPVVATPFRATDEPNLRVTGIWFTGASYALPGSVEARLDTAQREVTVRLTRDRARYEPGATATITVRTTDRRGRPVSASVVIRGIDEKLVAIGAAELADPLPLLYRAVAVGPDLGPAASHEAWLPACCDGGGATGGGGEGVVRENLRDTLPAQLVTTGAAGTARVSVRLPDDITSWQVGAAALTADHRAGQATIRLRVGLPFFVEALVAPEYLVGDRVGIRVGAYGSDLAAGDAVRFTVSSPTLGMAARTVSAKAFAMTTVRLPALTPGAHRVVITARSAAGRDTLVRTFTVVASRLTAARRHTIPIAGSVAPPGGTGITTLLLTDAGRARYLDLLLPIAGPPGQRSDEQVAAEVARRLLVDELGLDAADLPPAVAFDRLAYQVDTGLSLLPYGGSELELTVRALLADPTVLDRASIAPWLDAIAQDAETTGERRTVALVGLAALGEPVLGDLVAAAEQPGAGDRTRLWAGIGLGLLGDVERAGAVERSILERWGERRGDLVRLRISDDAEEVSQATDLAALLAAVVLDPLADDLLAYVAAVPPRDTLAVLTQVTVAARRIPMAAAGSATVAVIQDGVRTEIAIPAGEAVALHLLPSQVAATRLEPVAGAATVTAFWQVAAPSAADLGAADPDLRLTRRVVQPQPIPAGRIVTVLLKVRITGPGRDGTTEVVDLAPSGLVPFAGTTVPKDGCSGAYEVWPSDIEGQRVMFTVDYSAPDEDDEGPHVPGTFCLAYQARIVTAGTYAWQPAVARQTVSPGLVATTPAATVELR